MPSKAWRSDLQANAMLRRTTSILKGVTSWSFDLMRGLSVLEDTMGALIFVCPATGKEVPTGIEMDLASLKQLEGAKIYCPHCRQSHQMAGIS